MTHNSRSPAREFGLDSVSVNIEVGHTDTDKVGNPSKRVPTFLTRRGKALALVAIGANPLDFFPTASPSSHHPHRPLGTGQFVVSFSPNLFLLPITFFRKTFSDRLRTPPLTSTETFGMIPWYPGPGAERVVSAGGLGGGSVVTVDLLLEFVILKAELVKVVLLLLMEGRGSYHHLPDPVVFGGILDEPLHSLFELLLALVVFGLHGIHPLFHEGVECTLHPLPGTLAELFNPTLGIIKFTIPLLKPTLELLDVSEHIGHVSIPSLVEFLVRLFVGLLIGLLVGLVIVAILLPLLLVVVKLPFLVEGHKLSLFVAGRDIHMVIRSGFLTRSRTTPLVSCIIRHARGNTYICPLISLRKIVIPGLPRL